MSRTYENKLVVLADAPEAIGAAVAARLVERECRDKRRVALPARDHALLPGRDDRHEVILAAGLREQRGERVRRPNETGDRRTRMKRPSGDHATDVSAPK